MSMKLDDSLVKQSIDAVTAGLENAIQEFYDETGADRHDEIEMIFKHAVKAVYSGEVAAALVKDALQQRSVNTDTDAKYFNHFLMCLTEFVRTSDPMHIYNALDELEGVDIPEFQLPGYDYDDLEHYLIYFEAVVEEHEFGSAEVDYMQQAKNLGDLPWPQYTRTVSSIVQQRREAGLDSYPQIRHAVLEVGLGMVEEGVIKQKVLEGFLHYLDKEANI